MVKVCSVGVMGILTDGLSGLQHWVSGVTLVPGASPPPLGARRASPCQLMSRIHSDTRNPDGAKSLVTVP